MDARAALSARGESMREARVLHSWSDQKLSFWESESQEWERVINPLGWVNEKKMAGNLPDDVTVLGVSTTQGDLSEGS